jgi:hypothetical protein
MKIWKKPAAPAVVIEPPILQFCHLTNIKIGGKTLNATDAKLNKYIRFASQHMEMEISAGDVIQPTLKILFDRDSGFKTELESPSNFTLSMDV